MDPLTAKAGQTALGFAADRAADLIQQARKRGEEDVVRCERFLEAALVAIEGLEREYDEILVDASNVGDDPGRAASLDRRIDEYLRVDRLRPRLHDAIKGLEFYFTDFLERSERYLQWPWRRRDRRRAVSEFAQLLSELRTYLRNLDSYGLEYRSAGTGVGIEALFAIKRALDTPDGLRQERPNDVARRYQADRDKEPMFQQIAQIRTVIERLRQSFRT